MKQLDSVCLSEPRSVILWVSHLFFSSIASRFSFQLMSPHFSCVTMVTLIFSVGLIFHPLTRISVVFFCPAVFFLCGVCLCRVNCVFLCTSWRSEGSPRWPGPSAPCLTWPRPDTPSPQRQPPLDPPSTSSQHDHAARAQSASCVSLTDDL